MEHEDGFINASIQYANIGEAGAKMGVNFLPGGGFFNYYKQFSKYARATLSFFDKEIEKIYVLSPDEDNPAISVASGVNDGIKTFGKNTPLKYISKVLSPLLIGKDISDNDKSIKNDNYLHGMINESGLNKELSKIKDPNKLFEAVLFIDNYLKGYDDYEKHVSSFNKYFDYVFSLSDYNKVNNTLWNRITGRTQEEKDNTRTMLRDVSSKLKEAFYDNFN